ncbi:Endoribonuclease XendoU [Phlyctochytrium arcticum]|nr:Endoribonuclease XendoU [Phlyctochytrium arcticum]
MWSLDSNRLQPGRDLKLNLQRSTKVHMTVDNASEPLFANMTTDIFRQRPTYQHFASLLDNYIAENGTAEVVGHNELGEQNAFIEALLGTHPIQYLHQILIAKNLAPNGIREFGEMLKCIWFGLYKRQVHNDSSAFEHTFIGEIKPGQGVVGFHNWIQLFFEELKGHADYRGYILPRNRNSNAPPPENSHVLSIQLAWKGEVKPVSTFFIGTSPEFEIALYTLVFLAGAEDNQVTIEGVDVNLKCHKFRNNQGMRLGSCYPISG